MPESKYLYKNLDKKMRLVEEKLKRGEEKSEKEA